MAGKYLLYISVFVIISVLFTQTAYTQDLKGIVFDTDNERIPYVNIGVSGTPYGTVSFEDGTFSLKYDDKFKDDSLLISAIGYESSYYPIFNFFQQQENKIVLRKKIYSMEEVIVSEKKPKFKILGPRKSIFDGSTLLINKNGGSAMGIKIPAKEKSFKITRASIYLVADEPTEFQLRLRFFENQNGLPGAEFTPQNIILNSTVEKDRVWIELFDYDIIFSDSFFIVYEWVYTKEIAEDILNSLSGGFKLGISKEIESKVKKTKSLVMFRTKDLEKKFSPIYRDGSQGKWQKSDTQPLISVEIQYL